MYIRFLLSALLVFFAGAYAVPYVFGQAMQSSNYRIQDDSINVGGGFASSTSYVMENTVGEVGTGLSSSTNYVMNAGYQQMHDFYLALSGVSNVTLSPSLGGLTGGTSNGATSFTATTDSYAGYQVTIAASTSPAMQSGSATIADYAPGGGIPDFTFSVAANQSRFAFSPEGVDIPVRYQDNGVSCNAAGGDTTLSCWDGLSTAPLLIASRTSANHPSGTETELKFRVGIGASSAQREGVYSATTTVTLLSL